MQSANRIVPDWARGPVILTGNWEPLIFQRRMNYGPANTAELYRKNHTPELVQRAEEAGINLIITHYFKGFGLQAEAPDMDYADTLIALAHERNIRVGGYIGDTFIYETMLAEEPDAADWAQRMADGAPITYSGTSAFRYRWCHSNPAFMTYMQRVLTRAVNSGLDMIHFDNLVERPEPASCHCPHCQEAFRAYLLEKFTDEQRIERFGFADMTHVIPPVFSYPMAIEWQKEVIVNPLLQEWIHFRCHTLATRFAEMADFCRSLNPQISIESNPTGIMGESSQYLRGVDHARILPHCDFFWDESPNPFGVLENGAICTHIRSMKMGEPSGSRAFSYGSADLRMAEGLAFNRGCLGMAAGMHGDTLHIENPHFQDYARLLYAKPDVFCAARSMAQIAVYRNFPSFAYNTVEPVLQAILAEETLLEYHIPFDIILTLDDLHHRLLLLPGTESLAQEEIDRITAFVQQGGTLVITGETGNYDNWRRARPTNPFDTLLAGANEAAIGQGMLIRVPALELPDAAPSLADREVWDGYYQVIDARYWLLPRNAEALVEALRRDDFSALCPVTVHAPRTTFVEPRIAADGQAVYIHVINYQPDPTARELVFAVAGDFAQSRVIHTVPGRQDHVLPSAFGEGQRYFVLDNRSTYSLLTLAPA